MAISRGVQGSGNGNASSVSLATALASASVGQLAVVSVVTTAGVSHTWSAGWTVLYNSAGGLHGGATASVAYKVLTSADFSSGSVSFGSSVSFDYAFITYNGAAPSVDSAGSAYGQLIASSNSETGVVSATPNGASEWLVGILVATSVNSPTVTGSVALALQQNGIFYTPGPAMFDSNGTVSAAALTETFSTGNAGYYALAAFLVCVKDVSPGFFAFF